MTGFRATDHEINHDGAPYDSGSIELGIVTKFDAGDGDTNDGNQLIEVRLLRGGHGDEDEQHRLWCRMDARCWYLPDIGDQVTVAVPAQFGPTPGASTIIAVTKPNPQPLPTLKANEPILMGPARNFVRCHTDGKISLFTTDDGTQTGKAVFAQIRPDGFRLVHPYAKFILDKTGCHVFHSSGARIDLGAVSGMPAPLDSLGSYATVSAAMVKVEGSAIAIGTGSGAPDAVAHATPTLTVLGALNTALAAVATALSALTAPGSVATAGTATAQTGAIVGAAATAIANAATAITTAASTLATQTPLLPTNSTTVE